MKKKADILERLRNYIPGENDDEVAARIAEAADEIERLQDEVEYWKHKEATNGDK